MKCSHLVACCRRGEVVWPVQCGVQGGVRSHSFFRSDVGLGHVPYSVCVCVWLYWAFTVEKLVVTLLLLGSFWVLLVRRCHLLLQLGAHMCFAMHLLSLLRVSTGRWWSSSPSSTGDYSRDSSRSVRQSFLAAWIRFWWRSSSLSDWKCWSQRLDDISKCFETWCYNPFMLPQKEVRKQDARPTATVSS